MKATNNTEIRLESPLSKAKTVYPDKTYRSHEEWRHEVLKLGEPAESLIASIQAISAHSRAYYGKIIADMLDQAVATYRAHVELNQML